MPRVLNKKRSGVPTGAVYIGRPGKWGNPFVISRDGTRPEVVAKYRAYLLAKPALMAAAVRGRHCGAGDRRRANQRARHAVLRGAECGVLVREAVTREPHRPGFDDNVSTNGAKFLLTH